MENGVQILSKHIIISSLCFNKKAHFLLLLRYYIWKEKISLLKNICVASKIMYFQGFFFLEWLKSCSSSVLLIIVIIRVLVMESLQAGTQKALDLNACK